MRTGIWIHLAISAAWLAAFFYIARNLTMKGWQDFLDSLSTSGGNVVTLFFCSMGSGLLWWTVYNQHGSDGQAVMATFGIFGGFTGALLQAQKGNASRQQMMDRAGVPAPPAVVPLKNPTDVTVVATGATTDPAAGGGS